MSLLNKIEEINLAAVRKAIKAVEAENDPHKEYCTTDVEFISAIVQKMAEQSQADIPLEFMGTASTEEIVSLLFVARIAKEEIENLYKVVSHQRDLITEQANQLTDMRKRQDDFINLMLIQSNQLKALISINKTLIEEINDRDESSLDM
ncbi:hypothetical protein G3495_12955 [Shewanella baltica]|uniref:hypothetical protein n=1 Tax=Shewanella baltica TaxID=62322 RepID=UPI00217EC8EE|nr:hypothetical protein [Shewanella baltica]MCS6236025.1 hypothetical protein [Shewanella baltica]MCS6272153.1 hypothetical protein [Shewanella baltica]